MSFFVQSKNKKYLHHTFHVLKTYHPYYLSNPFLVFYYDQVWALNQLHPSSPRPATLAWSSGRKAFTAGAR